MENFVVGVLSSIAASLILILLGKWKGWWWSEKTQASVSLATNTLKILEGELETKTRDLVLETKFLGESLMAHYTSGSPYDLQREQEAQKLLTEMITIVKPLSVELSAADPELDHLKRAVIAYQKGLEWRERIIKHLCHPPNRPAMDAGHVRDQLLSENVLPHDLLDAAKGEAAIFLRGYGVSWLARRKYLQAIVKRHRSIYNEAVDKDYRKVLQQTSLHKAKSENV
jgi:hypothetical protein